MLREWRYRLEKGRPHLILLVGLLLLIIAISVVGGLLVYALGAGDSASTSIWWTFLHVTDPGYLGDDSTPGKAILGTIFTILGMVTFMAGLVGILTSLITSGLIGLREGGAPIAFRQHIVIVGWNARVFTLVTDLLHADDNHKIAILARLEKSDAEQQLEKRVFNPIELEQGSKAAHGARGQVVYRQGTPLVDHDLNRVAAAHATRFILLATNTKMADRAADVSQIRSLYSIERSHIEGSCSSNRFNTVVELASDQLRSHAFYSLRIDPRLDAWVAYYEEQLEKHGRRSFLPKPGAAASSNDMTAVNTDQIVSRVIVQCALQPFLSVVYEELFSFRGKELILWQPDQQWHDIWADMLALQVEKRTVFLARHMANGLVIGKVSERSFSFDPADWSELNHDSQYVVLCDKQFWSEKPNNTQCEDEFAGLCQLESPTHGNRYRVLVLGLNRRFPLIVEQFIDYAEQRDGTSLTIDVVALEDEMSLTQLPAEIELNFRKADFTDWSVLGELLETEASYNTIVLLGEDTQIDDPEVDARVTLALVMLRAYQDDDTWSKTLEGVNIVAEVHDPRNRDILKQVKLVGDVVVGDEYVSGFIAQMCIDHRLEELCRELLDYGNCEIYTRHFSAGDGAVCFGDLINTSAKSGEMAIGFLKQTDGAGMLPILAPALDTQLSVDDLPLVIARD